MQMTHWRGLSGFRSKISELCIPVIICGIYATASTVVEAKNYPVLTAETRRPEISMFIKGETVCINFKATNLKPENKQKLFIEIADVYGKTIKKIEQDVAPGTDGKWAGSINVKADRMGSFRVYARLSDGTTIKPLGSRPGSFITYGVTFDPATRKLYPESETFFGMQGRPSENVPIQEFLGIRWVLGPHRWNWMEPQYPGQFADFCKKQAKAGKPPFTIEYNLPYNLDGVARKWTLYPVFRIIGGNRAMPSKWKEKYYTKGTKPGWGVLTSEGEKYFRNYCRAFAQAVVKSYPDLKKRYYEVIWEPEIHFKGTMKDILRYLEIAYPVIHESDDRAVVMGPNLAGMYRNTIEHTRELFKLGMGKYIDAYSIHPYIKEPPEKQGFVKLIRELKQIIKENSTHKIEIVGTEFGKANNGLDPDILLRHAAVVARQNLIMLGEDFNFSLSFFGVDNTLSPNKHCYGFFYNLNPPNNYLPKKASPKPQAISYAAMSYLVEGHKSAGPIEWLGKSILGYAYERDNNVVVALWDIDNNSNAVKLPVGKDEVTVYDMMGNAEKVKPVNGIITLRVDSQPRYVTGVSSEIWGSKALNPIKIQEEKLKLFPGDSGKLTVTLKAPAKSNLSGSLVASAKELKVNPANTTYAIPAGKDRKIYYNIVSSASLPAGTYRIDFTLMKDGEATGGATAEVQILPPCELGPVRPYTEVDGNRKIRFKLTEVRGKPVSGQISLRIAGLKDLNGSSDFSLKPHESLDISLPCNTKGINPAKKYKLDLIFKLKSGYQFKYSDNINFISAAKVSDSFTIDGDTAKWRNISSVLLDKEFCIRNPASYSGDTANIKFAWNRKALYMLVEVTDKDFIQRQTGSKTWADDSLQCGFCVEPWKKFEAAGNTLADEANLPKQTEIELALTPKGPEAWRGRAIPAGSRWKTGLLASKDCPIRIIRKNDKTIYEAAFPWLTLGLDKSPVSGEHIAITIAVNDRDHKVNFGLHPELAPPSAMSLYNGATSKKERELMGILHLQ